MTPATVAVLRESLKGARLLPDFRFHSVRHTYASLCIAAGIAPFKLSKFMGHTNTNVSPGTYAHLFEDDHTDVMAAIVAVGQTALADNVLSMRADYPSVQVGFID
ncbi:tyrosine-type recombinase/integrase [Rhodococcus fascians]|nr:tyrosine-type recombinase/integrase [Rhodococcus fascians]MBY4434307.1 tyrosine-type recombinase/integrase [Rhodococcus fascians]